MIMIIRGGGKVDNLIEFMKEKERLLLKSGYLIEIKRNNNISKKRNRFIKVINIDG